MQQKFCHECGKSVVADAKFCAYCGTNLSSLASTRPPINPPPRPVLPSPTMTEAQEDDEYIDRIPHLDLRQNELHVEIVRSPIGKETVRDNILAGMSAGAPEKIEPRISPTSAPTPEQVMEEFKREAGTLRNEKK